MPSAPTNLRGGERVDDKSGDVLISIDIITSEAETHDLRADGASCDWRPQNVCLGVKRGQVLNKSDECSVDVVAGDVALCEKRNAHLAWSGERTAHREANPRGCVAGDHCAQAAARARAQLLAGGDSKLPVGKAAPDFTYENREELPIPSAANNERAPSRFVVVPPSFPQRLRGCGGDGNAIPSVLARCDAILTDAGVPKGNFDERRRKSHVSFISV